MTSEILTDEQLESFKEAINKIVEAFEDIVQVIARVAHEIIEWLTEEKPVFKRMKKGSRCIRRVVDRRPLFAFLARRC